MECDAPLTELAVEQPFWLPLSVYHVACLSPHHLRPRSAGRTYIVLVGALVTLPYLAQSPERPR